MNFWPRVTCPRCNWSYAGSSKIECAAKLQEHFRECPERNAHLSNAAHFARGVTEFDRRYILARAHISPDGL